MFREIEVAVSGDCRGNETRRLGPGKCVAHKHNVRVVAACCRYGRISTDGRRP
jgi:hypothetical protein